MLHHEYDALKGYRFLGGAISFYSVSCMSDVIFNPSLLNWSSLILTVAHIYMLDTLGMGPLLGWGWFHQIFQVPKMEERKPSYKLHM